MGSAIIWTTTALHQLDEIYTHILNDSGSVRMADNVVTTLYESTDILKTYPEIYSLDAMKTDNDGTIRAYEKYHYRISYRIAKAQIYILRVRHTSRAPLPY